MPKERSLEELRGLWEKFGDVPVDNEDRIERGFMGFRKGTDRFDVWYWFDDQCPHGLVEDIILSENAEDSQE